MDHSEVETIDLTMAALELSFWWHSTTEDIGYWLHLASNLRQVRYDRETFKKSS